VCECVIGRGSECMSVICVRQVMQVIVCEIVQEVISVICDKDQSIQLL
jgi:hypothetical protein